LDVSTEARIVHTMKQQAGGRLLVAHRPETIRAADVIYEVRNGAVQPIAPLTEPTSPPRPVAIPLTRGPASPA
jgi:ATP-binding cassette subfamily B protein RaxB